MTILTNPVSYECKLLKAVSFITHSTFQCSPTVVRSMSLDVTTAHLTLHLYQNYDEKESTWVDLYMHESRNTSILHVSRRASDLGYTLHCISFQLML